MDLVMEIWKMRHMVLHGGIGNGYGFRVAMMRTVVFAMLFFLLSTTTSCGFFKYLMHCPYELRESVKIKACPDSLNTAILADFYEVKQKSGGKTMLVVFLQKNKGQKQFAINRSNIEISVNGTQIDSFHYVSMSEVMNTLSRYGSFDWYEHDSTYVIGENGILRIEFEADLHKGDSVRLIERNLLSTGDSLVAEVTTPTLREHPHFTLNRREDAVEYNARLYIEEFFYYRNNDKRHLQYLIPEFW